MWITSTHQLIIRSLAPSPATAPFDSCQSRVMRNQQNFYSQVPPTVVVKLLQHSGLGSNTGMGLHPMNDLHQCLENGESFVWIFGFLLKTVWVVCLLTNCKSLK